ncbi:MAG: O-antigen ligase family protein [Cyclobacteriaceae bacterium]|nr:O-antigen ligase family protein [Cyclobacteriaceae bacterium]
MGTRLIAQYYLLFLCLNIFLPKIDFGFGQFYVFDFVNILLFGLLIARGRIFANSPVITTYALFMVLGILTFVVGMINFSFFDATSFFRLLKFTLFLLFLVIPYYLYREYSFKDLMRVLNFQVLFVVLSGLYVVYHMIFQPMSASDYAWSYDNRYRLIGLTSYAVDLDGSLKLIGSTSVSMGVFLAFLILVFFSLYKFHRKTWYLVIVLILLGGELLTYSRAGILTLLIGFAYYFFLNLRPVVMARLAAITLAFIVGIIAFDATQSLSRFGTITKITTFSFEEDSSIGTRVNMLEAGMQYIADHPITLLWGSGYGEAYIKEAIGYDHLEGLVPTTLFTSGLIAVLVVVLHFYFVWYLSKWNSRSDSEFRPFMYGLRLFVPGWFVSSALAGNTFQTDFYFATIYFVFFVSYFKIRAADAVQPKLASG